MYTSITTTRRITTDSHEIQVNCLSTYISIIGMWTFSIDIRLDDYTNVQYIHLKMCKKSTLYSNNKTLTSKTMANCLWCGENIDNEWCLNEVKCHNLYELGCMNAICVGQLNIYITLLIMGNHNLLQLFSSFKAINILSFTFIDAPNKQKLHWLKTLIGFHIVQTKFN